MAKKKFEIKSLLDRYTSFRRIDANGNEYSTETALIRIQERINRDLPSALEQLKTVDRRRVAIVMDENTQRATGKDLLDVLTRARWNVESLVLMPRKNESVLMCDDARVEEVQTALKDGNFTHAIAVGSGTLNDLVKTATYRLGFSYTSVATSPSMNGYTSSISSVLSEGVKTTQRVHAATAVFADPEVMALSPYRMIASGLGDLYSKPVSNADWQLSRHLLGTSHSSIVMEIVNAGNSLLKGVAPQLPYRDRAAVANLTAALMLSGLGMQAAGTSGPASGGEHLISHYIDMISISQNLKHDFHGCQVAVGSVTTSHLYEQIRALDPKNFNIEHLAADHPKWSEYEQTLRTRFGILSKAVLQHAQKMYPTRAQVHTRLRHLVGNWDVIFRDVGTTLRPSLVLKAELDSANCPACFPHINVNRELALDSIRYSKDIRARYTILHLASELGVLEDLATHWIDKQYISYDYQGESFLDLQFIKPNRTKQIEIQQKKRYNKILFV